MSEKKVSLIEKDTNDCSSEKKAIKTSRIACKHAEPSHLWALTLKLDCRIIELDVPNIVDGAVRLAVCLKFRDLRRKG